MKAAVLDAIGSPLAVREVPDPTIGTGDVIIDVAAARVLPYMKEVLDGRRPYLLKTPIIPGSGGIGRIRAVGPDATRLKPGDWVFVDSTVRARDDAVSPDIILQGLTAGSPEAMPLQSYFHDGSFAERMRAPTENVTRLDLADRADAIRWSGLGTCLVPYGGLLAGALQPGETALVSGATGNFGSAGVAVALAMGAAAVVAPGRNRAALADLARRFGSRVKTVALSGDETTDVAAMKAAAGPVDLVLDLMPPLPNAAPARAAALAVRPNGRVVLMGGIAGDIALPYGWLMRHNVTVRGQWMYPRTAPARLAALVRAGLLDLSAFESAVFALDDIHAALDHAEAHGGPFRGTVVAP
ncbi:MAG: zinc-binding alcohol dehydrogenase family protein [Methylobacteriaceae bacterium]|nr:zinc-binding alcohol dehydrogenase family protein [Rhodoblastus sp.]MCC0005234.1 zinc-binding alcohol dehydrogenase family protein [Methylobacteriaceae bacterium]